MKDNISGQSADPYPSHLSIGIDQARLCTFLRVCSLVVWIMPLSFFGAFFGLCLGADKVEGKGLPLGEVLVSMASGLGKGLGIAVLIGLTVHLLFRHRQARRYAETLEVSVEGSYLRIRHGGSSTSDRKIHFRSIVDYDARQSWLMNLIGIQSLHMNTNGGGPGSVIVVAGIKDCLQVRDMLSEIDSLRENR